MTLGQFLKILFSEASQSFFTYLVIFHCLHILKQEVYVNLVICLVVYFSEIMFKFSSPANEEENIYICGGLVVLGWRIQAEGRKFSLFHKSSSARNAGAFFLIDTSQEELRTKF